MVLNRLDGDPKAKSRLLATLRKLYRGIDDYHVRVQAGSVQVFLKEGAFTIPATRLSDGTLRYLSLLAILCDPSPPPLICIEEPELGLHPDIMPGLADLLREVSERCQLIVTTHSDTLVDALTDTPESVVICEKEDGQTKLTPQQGGPFPLARELSTGRALDLRRTWWNPLVKVKVYVGGGGDSKDLGTRCRMGFSSFFEKATLAGRMPQVIAGGSRRRTFEKFCVALRARKAEEFVVLLVDSEDPVAAGVGPWQYLAARDGWPRLQDATDEHAHLMVQCMEAWFFADPDALADYFGRDFNPNVLPRRREFEEIAKADLFDGLKNATRRCQKGAYGKGRHSFDILARITPARILDVSPHAERLVHVLREKAG